MAKPSMAVEATSQTTKPPNRSRILSYKNTRIENPWSLESVLSSIPNRPQDDTDSPIPFLHILERLKTTKRAGWCDIGINNGESISDHMYRMSILTMLAPPSLASRVNITQCMKMALVHDMAESLVGDITPLDGIPKAEKSRRESETMDYICKRLLGNVPGLSGEEIHKLWQEYEDDQTLEAHFVHDIDKIEHVLQMVEYERSHEGRKDLGEYTWVASRIKLPEVQKWCDMALEERKQFWLSIGKEPKWNTRNGVGVTNGIGSTPSSLVE